VPKDQKARLAERAKMGRTSSVKPEEEAESENGAGNEGEKRRYKQTFAGEHAVTSSSLSGDGRTLVVTEGKKAIVRNADTGAKLHEFYLKMGLHSSLSSTADVTCLVAQKSTQLWLFVMLRPVPSCRSSSQSRW
jgi:hypothetical protein